MVGNFEGSRKLVQTGRKAVVMKERLMRERDGVDTALKVIGVTMWCDRFE